MKKLIYCCVLIVLITKVHAQNVTITPDGITPVTTHPRISYDAILALPSPQEGDLAYDTTFKCLRIYTDGKWLCSYQDPSNYTPNMTPLVSIKGPMFDTSPAITADATGNTYIIGRYSGTVTIGTTTFTSLGHSDIFIAKHNKSGVLQWVKSAGGADGEYGSDIAVDAGGYVYITGGFSGTATFGSTDVTSAGSSDVFVAKYTNSGVLEWIQSAGGTGSDQGTSIAVDGSGNAYITGNFSNTATFGTSTVTAQYFDPDVFVAKCNSSGVFQWAQSGGGGGGDSGSGIGVDSSGNVYVTGTYMGSGTFGTSSITMKGNTDIFLVKYDNNGVFQWIQTVGNPDYDVSHDLAVDNDGNIYITGNFWGTVSFGDKAVTSQGGRDLFLTKYDGNGNAIWAKSAGGTNLEAGTGIAVDGMGVYITGHYSSPFTFGSKIITSNGHNYDILVAKFNKSNGSAIWAQTAGGTEIDEGTGIALDGNGNVYVVGNYTGTVTFGKTTKTSQGDHYDVFVIRIDK
jgi:hypothetical protein